MNKLKSLTRYTLYTVLACVFASCSYPKENYPKYSLETIEYVPDSLKVEHRLWIKETIRAASQQMTGGDYEDVDATIRQAKWTADELFQVSIVGLRKEINDNYYDDLHLKPKELNLFENTVLDSLTNTR
jgi:hypothetical protein